MKAQAYLPQKETVEKLLSAVLAQSRPGSSQVHLIEGMRQIYLFIVNGSRLLPISEQQAEIFRYFINNGDESAIALELALMGAGGTPLIDDRTLSDPPLYALSLAIAQKCNMGCSYCYAGQGSFGGPAKNMNLETAIDAVNLLLEGCEPGGRVQLAFLGGEPLSNRKTLRAVTEYAVSLAAARKVFISFSITTNGTLLTEEDADFFEHYGFAVTVSLDGLKEQHDAARPLKNGDGTYDRIMNNVRPLLSRQRRMQVSVRATVSPQSSGLPTILNTFLEQGFHSVGFSPLLNSSAGKGEMDQQELVQMLGGMIECGLEFEYHTLYDERFPFLNMLNSLKEIGKATHRPYPCGAGAGYFGVSADGDLAACHRFVNEDSGNMGNLKDGVNTQLQQNWLSERHVHNQEPCHSCWARYLCGGGCHHEVLAKGRNACHYIRGWLYYTLQAYTRLETLAPSALPS